ncbi:nucleotide sugar dehydrogenase [Kibdelosporangium persicum]|uniref:Nucleotide sugar dehydrogenase n=1 Tax=Kibdelosporangium persicum TaxID=2698649 RepID=A0ABX2F5J4_9PSEU|nr:nucleotide sugar dehydrogenase [Kibdelosporangium persicum]NRN66582.1 Nucleotide sugar dehydrogenase [Kibdelosporangium persicum]
MPEISSVAVIGMGYVGLPTALGLHAGGVRVLGIDRDPDRLAAIRRRAVDLIDADHLRLAKSLGQDGFELTADLSRLAEADAVMVCVPTPVDRYLLPDLGPLQGACDTLVKYARPGQTLILTSTSFVGTTARMLVNPLIDRGFTIGTDIFVASSPERIDPGNVTHTQRETPRVLGGVTAQCTAMAAQVIEVLASQTHRVRSPEVAEMTKLYENTFRAVNIALANEFADICAGLELDPIEVIDAAATKPYGFMAFHPGPGVGGHCIPCDPHYLLWQLRETRTAAPLVNQAMTAIAERPKTVVDRVQGALSLAGKGMAGIRVLVVGVSYKPGVLDVRSSSALEIIAGLAERGAKVDYFDPLIARVTLPDGTTMDSVVRPQGTNWDLVLVHTVQPGHDYGWTADCPMLVDATYRFESADASQPV